jgi:two-component system response regulator HydG
MSDLAVLIQRVARRNVTVLITGETGTGKERVAEAVVRASARANARFVRFNCASLSPNLAEAELFGHARGAFTGAVRPRAGLFREADRGTLLLDEVGELSLDTQAKLLRVIQSGEIRPIGEDRTEHVDVRLIAATHRDLGAMAAQGQFREDLFYRLNVATLRVPPLRERPEDIPVLARHFLAQASARFTLPPVEISAEIMARLTSHSWPGNVRELENSIERAAVMSEDGRLDPVLLPDPAEPAHAAPTFMKFKERVLAFERSLIATALETAKGNQSEAARLLDLSRATLQDKLKRHGFGS